jgi:hypothetical protein
MDYSAGRQHEKAPPRALAVTAKGEGLEVAAGLAAGGLGPGERFIHDAANGSKAPSALRAAAQAAMHLSGGPRRCGITRQRPADVVVADHVAGTNDHRRQPRPWISIGCNYR